MREPIGVVAQINPLEFSAAHGSVGNWPGAGLRMHHCAEACRTDAALRAAPGAVDRRSGFPPGVVNVLTGYGEGAGAPLAAHDLVDKVAFTGSTEVGKLIGEKPQTGNLKKVSLGTRRKVPAIVFPDAPIDQGRLWYRQRHFL